MMAGLLQKEDFDELLKWIGGRRKFRLLYKITRDGCSAPTFHFKCDGKGMTVTVLCNPSDTVYGGFTSQSWTSAGAYVPDPKAFLFQLKFNGKSSYNQFPIKPEKIAYAVCCHSKYGPTFGDGYDLYTFEGNLTASNGEFKFKSGCSLDNTYNMKGTNYNAFANGNSQVKEMEVYQVDDCDMNDPLEIPWRKTPEWTTRYRSYQVRNGPSRKPLNFQLCDTRGLEEGQGIDAQDVCYILDGHTPDKYVFNPSLPLSSDITGFIKTPKLKDQIHCVAFVLDASSVEVMSEKMLEKIRKLQIAMNQRGLPRVVLLTKIDKICASLQDDVGLTYYIPTVQEHVDKVAAMIGLPRSHVIPVKSYESERELNDNINILNLLAMQQILHFADDFLYNYLDDLDRETISTAD